MKKRLTPLLCALALMLGVFSFTAWGASSTPTVYLLAANDKWCDLPNNALPLSVGGTIYVPYTLFDKDATNVDLGVYYGIKQDRGTVLSLYSLNGTLTFSISQGVCTNGDGDIMSFRGIMRNNIPYVPARSVCDFFGLQYSYLTTTDRGILIRICSSSASLSNTVFLNAAASSMMDRYNNVLKAQASSTVTPTAAPWPTVTPTAVPTPPPAAGKGNVRVYLAVDASQAENDLTSRFPAGVQVLFLFTPDSLITQSALVRKAVAAGHSVGLIVEGPQEEVLAQLDRGNELLSHIARIRTHIVAAPNALTATLQANGWSCWQSNVAGTTAATLLANLATRRTASRLTLPAAPGLITQVVGQIRQDGYDLRQPLETDM